MLRRRRALNLAAFQGVETVVVCAPLQEKHHARYVVVHPASGRPLGYLPQLLHGNPVVLRRPLQHKLNGTRRKDRLAGRGCFALFAGKITGHSLVIEEATGGSPRLSILATSRIQFQQAASITWFYIPDDAGVFYENKVKHVDF